MYLSPDTRIAALAERRERLSAEAERTVRVLEAYFASAVAASGMMDAGAAQVSLLRHASMSNRESCGCRICTEWRMRGREFAAAERTVPKGHRWSICACPDCRFVGRMHLNYVAASNVRDLAIEMAFHADYHSDHGEAVMAWFEREIASPKYTLNWCACEIGRRPMDEWLKKCEAALSPVLSGAVFAAGEGRRLHFSAEFASQLGNAIAYAPMTAEAEAA